jgi:putative transposase
LDTLRLQLHRVGGEVVSDKNMSGATKLVLIHKGFRYRIYPTPQQEARLVAWESALRWLWNLANEQRRMGYARPRGERRFPTAFDQMRELTDLRAELHWLADVPRDVSSQLLVELDTAWQRCFKHISTPPRWKRKGLDFLGVTESHSKKWRIEGDVLHFPKLGPMRAVIHRVPTGKPKRCTIRREGDQWFASLLYEVEVAEPVCRAEPIAAIDRGVINAIADSDGRLIPNPRFYERSLKRLARAQRTVSRRKKGSKNREKAKLKVARLHRKVRRQREHFVHQLSHDYAKSHGTVVVEKLNVAGMVRGNRGTARGILDSGWGKFVECLKYKLAWSGGTLVEVPAHYSSQTCSVCDVVDKASRCREYFCCMGCGHTDHADINAAKVLKSRANRSALPVEGSARKGPRGSRKGAGSPCSTETARGAAHVG